MNSTLQLFSGSDKSTLAQIICGIRIFFTLLSLDDVLLMC